MWMKGRTGKDTGNTEKKKRKSGHTTPPLKRGFGHLKSDGTAMEIYKFFIKPLMDVKPDDEGQWLEKCFDTENRPIIMYRVKSSFSMPGQYLVLPHLAGICPKSMKVEIGEKLLARIEVEEKEVQLQRLNFTEEDIVCKMSLAQFEELLYKLEELSG